MFGQFKWRKFFAYTISWLMKTSHEMIETSGKAAGWISLSVINVNVYLVVRVFCDVLYFKSVFCSLPFELDHTFCVVVLRQSSWCEWCYGPRPLEKYFNLPPSCKGSVSSLNKDWLTWPVCPPSARAHWTDLQTLLQSWWLTAHLLKRLFWWQLQLGVQFSLCFGSALIELRSCFWLRLILSKIFRKRTWSSFRGWAGDWLVFATCLKLLFLTV